MSDIYVFKSNQCHDGGRVIGLLSDIKKLIPEWTENCLFGEYRTMSYETALTRSQGRTKRTKRGIEGFYETAAINIIKFRGN